MISANDIAAMRGGDLDALALLADKLDTERAEINSDLSSQVRELACDNEYYTPEWGGLISPCEDGTAWVMTWELVDADLPVVQR